MTAVGHRRGGSVDEESRSSGIIAVLFVASAMSALAVLMRCYGRLFLARCFGRDDAVMLLAQVLTIGSAVAIGLEVQWGLGRHTWTVNPQDIIPYLKAFYSSIIIYNMAACLTKVSIVLQYRRIFPNPGMQLATLISLYFLLAWTVAISFLLSLSCIPVAAFWDKTIKGRCLKAPPIWYFLAAVNLVTDFALLAMPIPVLSSLQLPPRHKHLLMAIFLLGIFPCSIAVYRIYTLHVALETNDPMWDNSGAATWSFLEITTGAVAASLPTLKPVINAIARCWPDARHSRDTALSSAWVTRVGLRHRGPVFYRFPKEAADPSLCSELGAPCLVQDRDSAEGLRVDYDEQSADGNRAR